MCEVLFAIFSLQWRACLQTQRLYQSPNVLVSYQLIGLFVLYVLDICLNKNEPSGTVDWASERLIGLWCTNQPFRFVLQLTQ